MLKVSQYVLTRLPLALALWLAASPAPAAPLFPVADGLQLWLDAADPATLFQEVAMTNPVTAAGQTVHAWADKSGFGHDALRSDDGVTYQTGALGGLPTVRFDRSQMTISGGLPIDADQDRTMFVIMRYPTQTQNNEILGTSTSMMLDVGTWTPWGTRNERLRVREDDSLYSDANSVPNNTDMLLTVQGDGAGTYAWRDGGQIINSTARTFHWNIDGENLRIGGANYGGREYIGDLAEVVVFDRSLNAAERTIVDNHLGAKYGLTLANSRYDGGDYTADVFGVGRVDAANQWTSGGMAGLAFNAPNLADDAWLLAGHNTPQNAWTTDGVPDGLTERWDRVWYLDVTGDPGEVDLTFDFLAGGLTLDARGHQLLYSPDNAYNFESLPYGGTIDEQTVTFAGLSGLASGYYTLAIPEPAGVILLVFGAMALLLRRRR